MSNSLRALLAVLLALLAGCSRTHYRQRADVDAYTILHEKAGHTPWEAPYDFDVLPSPGSRFHDPTPPDDPWLPQPAPQLYAYDLPQLPDRDPARFRRELPNRTSIGQAPPPVEVASFTSSTSPFVRLPAITAGSARAPAISELSPGPWTSELQRASLQVPVDPTDDPNIAAQLETLPPVDGTPPDALEGELRITPVPPSAWEDLPKSCLVRMFEFQSIRDEFTRSYRREPSASERDTAEALALEDVIELALLNSREYQTEKETLYGTALRLSLQRFDYELKPSVAAASNRIAATYTDDSIDVGRRSRLATPVGLQVDKMLATGGTLVASFANSVVLTFNGDTGFARDIGSNIVLDIQQTLLQIDVQFEPLTQAERDVVYAARDFARFRKTLFTTLATDYYRLIQTYRQVQIDAQNYLDLARSFRQAEAEYRAQQIPQFQVDQVEQQVLDGRRVLIQTCNSLEEALDNLKNRIGLPTETPIDIDLSELETLTLHDELAVRRELVRRVQKRLVDERDSDAPERLVLLSSAVDLIDRLLAMLNTFRDLGREAPDDTQLRDLRAVLYVQQARSDTENARRDLEQELETEEPTLAAVYGRTLDVDRQLLNLIERQIELARVRGQNAETIAVLRQTANGLRATLEQIDEADKQLYERVKAANSDGEDELDADQFIDDFKMLAADATRLREAAEEFVKRLDQVVRVPAADADPKQALRDRIAMVDDLLKRADQLMSGIGSGLVPIEIDFDDAMMTALVLRFDLMNERGVLADDWRQIKLAGDDLKSFLNLRATQIVRREEDSPFDFSFDDSTTTLNATLDLPFNRRAQRNTFRGNLIDYQAGLRRLMLAEDTIKLSVRNELRALALDREQYAVDVASAGLAFERVVSTQLELRLGTGGVTAFDYLLAQGDYIAALSRVAGRHINYIVDRMDLFLAMEVLQVDERGFWNELYDESAQPTPYYQLPPHAFPFYGDLPRGLHYSKDVRRMLDVDPGTSMFHRGPAEGELEAIPERGVPETLSP